MQGPSVEALDWRASSLRARAQCQNIAWFAGSCRPHQMNTARHGTLRQHSQVASGLTHRSSSTPFRHQLCWFQVGRCKTRWRLRRHTRQEIGRGPQYREAHRYSRTALSILSGSNQARTGTPRAANAPQLRINSAKIRKANLRDSVDRRYAETDKNDSRTPRTGHEVDSSRPPVCGRRRYISTVGRRKRMSSRYLSRAQWRPQQQPIARHPG